MRLVIALALALGAAGAAAAQPVSTAPLAARELLLEIDAVGAVRTPADRVVLTIELQATAATAAAARFDLAAREERLIAAAIAGGAERGDIEEARRDGLAGLYANETLAQMAAQQAGQDQQTARRTLEVAIRDRSAIERIRSALEAAGGNVAGPSYLLTDDAAPRQAARAQALARARADADAYAAALGMRVGRIVRVSERATIETASADMVQTMMRRFNGTTGGPDPEIETSVRVAVDFALLPR